MNNKIIIGVVVVVLIIAGAMYFLIAGRSGNLALNQGQLPSSSDQQYVPSEQPNKAKFDEYLRSIYMAKLPIGQELGAGIVPSMSVLFKIGTDQFCTALEINKLIPVGAYASAVYNLDSKTYAKPKTTFPNQFNLGTNVGCGIIPYVAGRYEYKAYINDVLVEVIPFEIRAASQSSSNNSTSTSPSAKTPSLQFSAGGCDASLGLDPYSEPFSGILSKKWVSGVFQTEAYVKTLCEGINFKGSYELKNNSLDLRYQLSHGVLEPSDCYCAHKMTYKLSNLDQKDYSVSLVGLE